MIIWEIQTQNLIVPRIINNKNQWKFNKTKEMGSSQKGKPKRICPKRTNSMPKIIVRKENKNSNYLNNKTVS